MFHHRLSVVTDGIEHVVKAWSEQVSNGNPTKTCVRQMSSYGNVIVNKQQLLSEVWRLSAAESKQWDITEKTLFFRLQHALSTKFNI